MTARIEHLVTSGMFTLDGQSFDVDNNVWLIGDDVEVLVVDPAHDAAAILDRIGGRVVTAIVCSHGHNDHIDAAGELADATGASVLLHPADRMLWDAVHPDRAPQPLADRAELDVAGCRLLVRHTPGHSPGGICLYAADLDIVVSGDTLFQGGPGATGRSYSDFPTILDSISRQLLELPGRTRVLTGHGAETTIAAESAGYDDWVARGH